MVSVYGCELFGGKLKSTFVGIVFMGYALGGVILNIHSIWWNYYKVYFVVQIILICIPSMAFFWMVESPFYSFKKNDPKTLYRSLAKITRTNYPSDEAEKIIEKFKKIINVKLYNQIKKYKRIVRKNLKRQNSDLIRINRYFIFLIVIQIYFIMKGF